jgi:hypothetical protein
MWCRTEGVVFIIAAIAVLFIYSIIEKKYRNFFIFASLSILPALFWVFFLKINNMYSEQVAITNFFWDIEKIKIIVNGILNLLNSTNIYSLTFVMFSVILILNIWFIIKRKDNLVLLTMILISLLCYMLILYHIDFRWDSIDNVLKYSSKRFMFCFVPLVWYYNCTNYVANFLFSKLENILSMPKKGRL